MTRSQFAIVLFMFVLLYSMMAQLHYTQLDHEADRLIERANESVGRTRQAAERIAE